eukprot:7275953-Lingulodinium_polyedra.AAC.1
MLAEPRDVALGVVHEEVQGGRLCGPRDLLCKEVHRAPGHVVGLPTAGQDGPERHGPCRVGPVGAQRPRAL